MSIADKLTTIAENQQKVYDAGYSVGKSAGYQNAKSEIEEVTVTPTLEAQEILPTEPNLISKVTVKSGQALYDEGKQAQYDAFWDTYQQNGKRKNYHIGFAGFGWAKETLNPKHRISIVDTNTSSNFASQMFYRCNGNATHDNWIDFSVIADKFDFSGVMRATSMFDSANIKNLYVDFSNCVYGEYTFASQWGGGVDNLTLKVTDKLINANNMFLYNSKLKEIRFTDDSELCVNINFSQSVNLSKASITSIINCLSTAKNGLTVTLSKTAVNTAFGINVDDETTYPAGSEFYELRHSKDNWTFSYV